MEIKIKVKNVKSQFMTGFPVDIYEKMSIPYENYWHMPKFKSGEWDGKYNFLDKVGKFPTGLLSYIYEFLADAGHQVEIEDVRKNPYIGQPLTGKVTLNGIDFRGYQKEAIEQAVVRQRGILHLPTGSGKTEIAIGITKALGLRTLYLVHTKDLLHQTYERFLKRGSCDVGRVGDDYKEWEKSIVIATVQTVHSMFKNFPNATKLWLTDFECLFLDECHHASSTTWYVLAMHCHNAFYRFGLSGTPLARGDLANMKLMACIEDRIYELPTKELQDKGDLCTITVFMMENKEVSYMSRWHDVYRDAIVNSEHRNSKIVKIAKKHWKVGNKVLILIREIQHGNNLHDALHNASIPTIFLKGEISSKVRDKWKERFDDKQYENFIIIATGIWDEGVDLPKVNVLILGAGGKSEVKTIQRVGRGLRKKDDGGGLIVYDFIDFSEYLDKHSERRMSIYQDTFGADSINLVSEGLQESQTDDK